MIKNYKIAILAGGSSREREVSLQSGQAIQHSLLKMGMEALLFDPSTEAVERLREFDFCLIALHGGIGEDGTIQGVLDFLGLPYNGSGVLASALAMDKYRTKLVLNSLNLPVVPYRIIDADTSITELVETLGLPLFMKPSSEGSSIGVIKITSAEQIEAAYHQIRNMSGIIMAEKFIDAGEYTIAILDGLVMPIIKIEPASEFYDYEAKYIRDDTKFICPAPLSPDLEKLMKNDALAAYHALGCKGLVRVDFLLDQNGAHYILELNTLPGMTSHSLAPLAAKNMGLSFDDLVLKIIGSGKKAY